MNAEGCKPHHVAQSSASSLCGLIPMSEVGPLAWHFKLSLFNSEADVEWNDGTSCFGSCTFVDQRTAVASLHV